MDLFDENDISDYGKFCEDNNIDPIVGYALLNDMEYVSSDEEGDDNALQTFNNDASPMSGVAPRVTNAAVFIFFATPLYMLW